MKGVLRNSAIGANIKGHFHFCVRFGSVTVPSLLIPLLLSPLGTLQDQRLKAPYRTVPETMLLYPVPLVLFVGRSWG